MNGNTGTRFLPRTFRGGGYEVTINADRSVRVKPGDWLSKYSMAIYGNFNHIDKFWRKNGAGYQTIIDKDLIRAGEILYHPDPLPGEPKHPGINPPVGVPPVDGEAPLRPENLARFLEWFKSRFVKTDWRVTETGFGGADLSFSFLTGQYQTICIEHEDAKVAAIPALSRTSVIFSPPLVSRNRCPRRDARSTASVAAVTFGYGWAGGGTSG